MGQTLASVILYILADGDNHSLFSGFLNGPPCFDVFMSLVVRWPRVHAVSFLCLVPCCSTMENHSIDQSHIDRFSVQKKAKLGADMQQIKHKARNLCSLTTTWGVQRNLFNSEMVVGQTCQNLRYFLLDDYHPLKALCVHGEL